MAPHGPSAGFPRAEAMSEALPILIVGILGVFANLLILMVLMAAVGRFLTRRSRAREDQATKEAVT